MPIACQIICNENPKKRTISKRSFSSNKCHIDNSETIELIFNKHSLTGSIIKLVYKKDNSGATNQAL